MKNLKKTNKGKIALDDMFDINGSTIFTENEKKSSDLGKILNDNQKSLNGEQTKQIHKKCCLYEKKEETTLIEDKKYSLSEEDISEQLFTLWKVPQYNLSKTYINNNVLKYNLDEKINILENNDESYHDRIIPHKIYKFFGDIDHYSKSFVIFRDKLIVFLKDFYNLNVNEKDIKHTVNHGTKGSYHFVISKYHSRPDKMKEILDNMHTNDKQEFSYIDDNGRTKRNIDTSIYSHGTGHWFRCPNQTKQGVKRTEHIIINGEMKDFIFDYIENDSITIQNKKFIPRIVTLATSDTKILSKIQISTNVKSKSSIFKNSKKTKILQSSYDEKEDVDVNEHENEKNYKNNINNIKNEIFKNEQYILYKFIDQCYIDERFSDYKYWINVGIAIKNRYGEDGFELFKYFSFKCPDHDTENELRKKYNSFNNNNIGVKKINIATLYFYAKEDNEKKYVEFIKKYSMFKDFEMTSTEIIKYIRMLKPNDFIWKNNELYCYNGKYWEKDDIPLKIYIGNEFYLFLRDVILTTCFFENKQFEYMKRSLLRLKTQSFKEEIVKASKEVFKNNDHKFDSNIYLLGFKNLVLDLNTLQFREYQFNDYITITTGYNWVEPKKSNIDKINQLIESIHQIKKKDNFFLNFCRLD